MSSSTFYGRRKRSVRIGLVTRQAIVAYVFLLPAFLYFSIFYFYPIILEFWISLQHSFTGTFVGFDNYLQALRDPRVINALIVTILFAAGVASLSIVLGLLLALLLNEPLKGRVIFRACILIPYMSSAVIVGLMWRTILDPITGLLNRILVFLHLPMQDWLANYSAALPTVIGITIWQTMGYTMLLFLAGLQGIPEDYYHAAQVDGAPRFARFRYITLPLLAPTTLFVSIISVINSLQAFAQAYIITQGGPADATRFYVFHVFNVAFNENNISYASAMTFLMFLAILVLTIIQFRLSGKEVEY